MPRNRLVLHHQRRVRAARSAAEIFDHTLGAAGELGFNRLAIVHASWFIRPGRRLIFHHNFDEWGEIFVARRYYRHDPALLYSPRTNRPFSWRELPRWLTPTPHQAQELKEEIHHGLSIGSTVPVYRPAQTAHCLT